MYRDATSWIRCSRRWRECSHQADQTLRIVRMLPASVNHELTVVDPTASHLTRHKISDREPTATYHAARAWMANTQTVSRSLARGSLHRLVRRSHEPWNPPKTVPLGVTRNDT